MQFFASLPFPINLNKCGLNYLIQKVIENHQQHPGLVKKLVEVYLPKFIELKSKETSEHYLVRYQILIENLFSLGVKHGCDDVVKYLQKYISV